MKIKELFETSVDSDKRIKYKSFTVSNLDDTIALMEKHCSDAVWMLEEDRPIYRGSRGAIKHNVSIADPSKTERISKNTTNYYTLIFDNHPEMKDFPKRSKSFIASTDYDCAYGYCRNKDNLNVLIPFNNVKIGMVGTDDIWDIEVDLFGSYGDIRWQNDKFARLYIGDEDFKSLVQYGEMLKNKPLDSDEVKYFTSLFDIKPKLSQKYVNNFIKEIFKAYAPDRTDMTWATTKNMDRSMDSEVWVGGKCLVIKYPYWRKMRLHYVSSMP